MSGIAPDRVRVRMGSRAYFNDNLIEPAFEEAGLDEDPWSSVEQAAPITVQHEHALQSGAVL